MLETNDISARTQQEPDEDGAAQNKIQTYNTHIPEQSLASWWWWWEIGAALLSVISMALIVGLLLNINDTPLSSWAFPIQPNSLLAVLTTLAKTTLLVPVASCIGQLKWRHFTLLRRSLDHLQLYDDASRGPWGSAAMVYDLISHVPAMFVPLCLAVLSITALGIDPSAQQIISVQSREIKSSNASVLTSRTGAYFSQIWDLRMADWKAEVDPALGSEAFPGVEIFSKAEKSREFLKFQKALYSAMSGSMPEPYYTCPEPALRCVWDDFSTLGICGRYRNITDSVMQNCSVHEPTSFESPFIYTTCDFWYLDSTEGSMCSSSNPNPISLSYIRSDNKALLDDLIFDISIANTSASIASIWIVKAMNITSDFDGDIIRTYESYASDFYWCDKVLHGTRTSNRGLTTSSVGTTPWAGMDGSSCSLDDISNPPGLYAAGSIFPYLFNLDNKTTYNISGPAYQGMSTSLESLVAETLNTDETGNELSSLIWVNTMETFTHNLADMLTVYMLTPKGDNMNVTTVPGYMIYNDTYIQIEWQWLILPLFETILTCVLLVVTIILTRGQPLMKNSTIALLVHGLSGWTPGELQLPKPETAENLDKLARDMTVRWTKDQEGILKFSREDGSG
ncbi:hypothetical protein F4818DRAFT_291167 [Hypoxylon cercidicola]|nr:hypothetical protein F4818DRAFT_291167 [Hypoxylon cercidicola]